MGFAGQASRSTTFAIYWAAAYRNKAILDQEGYLRKLALHVTWPSLGNTTVYAAAGGTPAHMGLHVPTHVPAPYVT
jgi:hypothetical protein